METKNKEENIPLLFEFYDNGIQEVKDGVWTFLTALVKQRAYPALITLAGSYLLYRIGSELIEKGSELDGTNFTVIILIATMLFTIVILSLRAVLKEHNGKKWQNRKTLESGASSRSP